MFGSIRPLTATWVSNQAGVLTDVQVLVANIDSASGIAVQGFIDRLARLDNDMQRALFRDHVFHRWLSDLRRLTLVAYDTEVHLQSNNLRSILNLLHLAVSVIERTELEFSVTSWSSDIILLPVTGFHFQVPPRWRGDESIVYRYDPGRGEVIARDIAVGLSRFTTSRSIKVADKHFSLFADPGDDEYAIEFDEAIDATEWAEMVAGAVDIVGADETADALVNTFVTYVVPLRKKEPLLNLSFSVRSLPGVVFKSNELKPYLRGETLVHEADHQFFYAVETVGAFWKEPVELQEPVFYSPWRDDPRPLDGILRGLSAFARVTGYYSAVLRRIPLSDQERDAIGATLLRRIEESNVALDVLVRADQLSPFGVEYVREVADTLSSSDREVRSLDPYETWKTKASEAVNARRERWRQRESRPA